MIIRTVYRDGTVEEREATAEEIAEQEQAIADAEARQAEWEAQIAERESARQAGLAKLVALGLTEAEAQAIIG